MKKTIVLIHGLGGDRDKTWGAFPTLLESDDDLNCKVITVGYESPSLICFWKRAPSISNIASGILTDISHRCDLEKDEIVLVGHSLGGIILKKMLLLIHNRNLQTKIEKVCFFDVPHDGSGYANAAKYISIRNRHLKSLTRDSAELDDLNDQWFSSDLSKKLNILSIICANDSFVSSSSSKSIFRNNVQTINNVDHRSIVKPANSQTLSYVVLKKFLKERKTLSSYKNASCRSFDEWLHVERNHGYTYAEDNKRRADLEDLIRALNSSNTAIRLTGASGLGKTRLIIEALKSIQILDHSGILIYNANGYENAIREQIQIISGDGVEGIVIVENCQVDLHNDLYRELAKGSCRIKILTIAYGADKVEGDVQIEISPLKDEAIRQLLAPILIDLSESDVIRVAKFVQGYPLMATLIAENYKKQGRFTGAIESDAIVRKLIEGDRGTDIADREILSACSLFDVFGIDDNVGEEAKFIYENIAGTNARIFDGVISRFSKRQIINRVGKYARVIPKPLALSLGGEWWESASNERKKALISEMPHSLLDSFCTQVGYLDFQPGIIKFADKLFGGTNSLMAAGALLTLKGSKLFRAFVEVNPSSMTKAIFHVLTSRSISERIEIKGEVRRNIIWGLEKLCFHADFFEDSSYCLLLLAAAETETWSNNATGLFSQLFRVHLSGTETPPQARLGVLRRAIACGVSEFDDVVIAALAEAINTRGGSRTVGAEYQGTRAPLTEWRAKVWSEIFDYWAEIVQLMFIVFERGDAQKHKLLVVMGDAIRGLVEHGRVELVDEIMRRVVRESGRYWPSALNSIKDTIQYARDDLPESAALALENWLEMLEPNPDNIPETLKIIVIDPPWEHRENSDGEYVDLAAERAKALAVSLRDKTKEIIENLPLLVTGEQKQSFPFGYQLIKQIDDPDLFIEKCLKEVSGFKNPNITFVLGLFRGMFEHSSARWEGHLDRIVQEKNLVIYYPQFIRTGRINLGHLDNILKLIKEQIIVPSSVDPIGNGGALSEIGPLDISTFCLKLSALGDEASWAALHVIYMYVYGKTVEFDEIEHFLKQLICAVSLKKATGRSTMDMHHWKDLANKLLKKRDEKFAVCIAEQIIESSKFGVDYQNILTGIKPLLAKLMRDYWELLWPKFGDAVIEAKGQDHHLLRQFLDRENSSFNRSASILAEVPVEALIEWCTRFPSIGPKFVAQCVNVLEDDKDGESRPSALFVALLENFGNDSEVIGAISVNLMVSSWVGSMVPYLEAKKAALSPLTQHPAENVRLWAQKNQMQLQDQIERESSEDAESELVRS